MIIDITMKQPFKLTDEEVRAMSECHKGAGLWSSYRRSKYDIRARVFIAKYKDELVGWGLLEPNEDSYNERTHYTFQINVKPVHRKRGIATLIVKDVNAYARKKKIHVINHYLDIYKMLGSYRRCYRRWG